MYNPKHFAINNFEQVKSFIQYTVLANIITTKNNEVEVCPVPLLWQDDGSEFGCLIGHVAKNNPVVNGLDKPCNVIFNDNGHYISPNWYPSKAITHKEVPTWNYQSVQLTVTPTLYNDTKIIKRIIGDMTNFFEQQTKDIDPSHQPWSIVDAPIDYIDAMCRALIGFKLHITDFEAKFKLSQNKSAENKQGVMDGLGQLNTPKAIKMQKLIKTLL